MGRSWICLGVAVLTEIVWALSLRYLQVRPHPLLMAASFLLTVLNMALLSMAMRTIPIGPAYAIWTGLGAVGVTVCGALLFGEQLGPQRLFFLAVALAGVAGLKLSS